MGIILLDIFLMAAGYILGSLPFGYYIAKIFYRTDIRNVGSKNIGATNVFRTLGVKPGLTTLALDIAKGALAVLLCRWFERGQWGLAILCGFLAIMGHNWSIFLKGKGGKGVATSGGVFLALLPIQTLIALGVFGVLFYFTRYVSVGSLGASLALLIATYLSHTPGLLRLVVLVSVALIIYKHLPNIKRLRAGTELKIKWS